MARKEVALSAKTSITKTTATLSRCTLLFNFRADISTQTRQMLNVGDSITIIHIEATPARIKNQSDNSVQSNIVKIQEYFKVFIPLDGSIESLHSIAIKYVATPEIQESLLSAEELGQSKLDTFDEESLVNATVKFRDRLQKSNSLTIKTLCKVSKVKDYKDRTMLQQRVIAFQASRKVDLQHTLLQ